ncbi:MAG TPA: hypothetical protein VNM90_00080, partial [Haliangium sp.]|nr:hypothetical protein [Haliangium sp.]
MVDQAFDTVGTARALVAARRAQGAGGAVERRMYLVKSQRPPKPGDHARRGRLADVYVRVTGASLQQMEHRGRLSGGEPGDGLSGQRQPPEPGCHELDLHRRTPGTDAPWRSARRQLRDDGDTARRIQWTAGSALQHGGGFGGG